jgi:short-subunit dehydrogenase
MRQVALVTGASSGIGLALAEEFAAHDYDLVLVSEQGDQLATVAGRFRESYRVNVMPLVQDLRREEGPALVHATTKQAGLDVDVLVNDAGVGQRGKFAEIPADKDLELIHLNVRAMTLLTKFYLSDMLARNSGRILNLGSIAGFQPGPLLAVYHATKAYVVSLSEALADELEGTGVTVTCLCPGPTATNFFARAGMQDTKVVQEGDMMSPADVARAGYEGLMKGERIVVPGANNKVMTFTRRLIPIRLQAKLNRRYYEQVEEEVEPVGAR